MRIRKTIISAFFIILSFESCTAQPVNPYGMFRGNAEHTGIYPSTKVSTDPKLKWRFKTNGYVNSSAAIEKDRLYFGSADSNLYCINITDGSLAWKFKTDGAVNSSPAVADGEVYFGSFDGKFYALDAANGNVKWSFKTKGEKQFSAKGIHGSLPKDSLFIDPWDFWLSSPVVQDRTVYFGSGDGYFYALDKSSGKEKWKFRTNGIIHSSPAFAFGNVYFGGWDTYLHAVNAETGKEVWKYKTGEDTVIYNQTGITSSAMINDGIVYFGCRDAIVYALDAVSGKFIWKRFNDRGWISQTPAISGDKLLYTSGSSHKFMALNKKTGDIIYDHEVTTGAFSSPSIVDGTVYYGDFFGSMYGMDIATGKQIWSYQPVSREDNPYHLFNADGSFNDNALAEAVKKYKGIKTRMQIMLSMGTILSSPVIKDGVVYFGSTDGYMYALQ